MSTVIHAEDVFLKKKEEHIADMTLEADLRETAARAASLWRVGLTTLSTEIINDVPTEHKTQFKLYLQEYLKYSE